MKKTDKKKPVSTMPKGVWEASRPTGSEREETISQNAAVDLQGNGYPSQRGEKITNSK